MENNTRYHFLGNTYDDLKSFSLALANNYADALNFIYQPEFLNQFTDSYLKGRLLAEQKRAYYATSCLAVTLFLLNPELGLVLDGKSIQTYDELVNCFDDENLRTAAIHLLKDHSVSHTFGLEDKSIKDIFTIENNIDDPGVVFYLQLYFDERFAEENAHGYKVLDFYLMQAISSSDPFAKYSELLFSPEFKGVLAHRYGLDQVLDWYNSDTPEYYILAKLTEDMNLDVMQIVSSGMHSYFFTTRKYKKNYRVKGIAKTLFRMASKTAKCARKDMTMKFSQYQIYFELYKYVTKAYDLGLISIRHKNDYALDYVYYNERANENYLDKVVNLNNFAKVEKENLDAKELKKAKKSLKLEIKKYRKNTYNNYFEQME